MNKIRTQNFVTPYGELIIGSFENQLCLCDWQYRKNRKVIDQRIKKGLAAEYVDEPSGIVEKTINQLTSYFNGEKDFFTIPLLLVGSNFQKQVWNELIKIPFGKKETYLGLSNKLNNPKAIRAIAAANGANAISIIVPCHRIVGSNGKLIGYAGGLNTKKQLLKLESKNIEAEQLQLFA